MVRAIQKVRGRTETGMCARHFLEAGERGGGQKCGKANGDIGRSQDRQQSRRTAFRFVRSATNKTVSNANIGKFLAGSETSKHFLGETNGETLT